MGRFTAILVPRQLSTNARKTPVQRRTTHIAITRVGENDADAEITERTVDIVAIRSFVSTSIGRSTKVLYFQPAFLDILFGELTALRVPTLGRLWRRGWLGERDDTIEVMNTGGRNESKYSRKISLRTP